VGERTCSACLSALKVTHKESVLGFRPNLS
jgi:hypothetical protein